MFSHPHLNTYQKSVHMPPPWLGGEELGGCLGSWVCGASKGEGMGERFDCLTCNAGVPCSMLFQMCGS